MKPIIEISNSLILQILKFLESTGVDLEEFSCKSGVDLPDFESPDTMVPIQNFFNIQESAIQIAGDKTFGLHLGEVTEPGNWLILGYIVMNCGTLHEALVKICRYEEVIGNFIKMSLSLGKKTATLSFNIRIPDSKNIRHCYEASVSSVLKMVRIITEKEVKPDKVLFSHSHPEDMSEYNRILGCPVLFEQENTSIVFAVEDLVAPIKVHNPELLHFFEAHAEKAIVESSSDNYYSKKVNSLIIDLLPNGTPGISLIARELALSVRSLQGRLSEEGATYRQILENVRKDLAVSYLKDPRFPIDDVAYLLGFSESGVFRKSFKKWMGVTPGEYRKI